MKLILASNSPRRKELLAGLGIDFEVKVLQNVDESYPDTLPKQMVAEYIAREKSLAYVVKDDELLITADTVVLVDGEIYGKPHDYTDAHRMLSNISNKTHQVVTGVCLKTIDTQNSFSVSTDVTFKTLSDKEIDYYINHYKPYDKAGAYGIQEWIGYVGVTSIRGSFFNVMGLPVQRLYTELTKYLNLADMISIKESNVLKEM